MFDAENCSGPNIVAVDPVVPETRLGLPHHPSNYIAHQREIWALVTPNWLATEAHVSPAFEV